MGVDDAGGCGGDGNGVVVTGGKLVMCDWVGSGVEIGRRWLEMVEDDDGSVLELAASEAGRVPRTPERATEKERMGTCGVKRRLHDLRLIKLFWPPFFPTGCSVECVHLHPFVSLWFPETVLSRVSIAQYLIQNAK